MKILWLSTRVLNEEDNGSTGSWIYALVNAFKNVPDIQVGNITMDSVTDICYNKFDNVRQWRVPFKAKNRNGLPIYKYKKLIIEIIKDFNPDIIHVWGVENYWGYITKELTNQFPILIEIQGLKKDIAPVYSGDLSNIEKLKSIGIKELLKLDTIYNRIREYKKWGIVEAEIIKSHIFFSTHSRWAEAKVKELNPECIMFKNERLLRTEFYSSNAWKANDSLFIYTSAGYSAPFKGLLTLIKAVGIIKRKYPNIVLNIAGGFQFDGIRKDGYIHFLKKYIQKLKLENSISFVGPLNGKGIVELLKKSSVAVFPSFVESYGLALAECMAVGIPLVATYNGGFSYLGRDNENVLFFAPGDVAMCAFQIDRILSSTNLSNFLSVNARETCLERNNPSKILDNQITIYEKVFNAVS